MAHRIRLACLAATGLALALSVPAPAAARAPALNRGITPAHVPTVTRTDYVLDLARGPAGLAPGEAQRLQGWFEGLRLGYGDSVTIDDPYGRNDYPVREKVGAILSEQGLLLSGDAAPVTPGPVRPGTVRVVVSRATAQVEGCPDWSVGNFADYAGATTSNFGCASETNLAAMIANPEDLIQGQSSHEADDAALSVKAIKAYRDAKTTGEAGLKNVTSKSASSGGQ